MRYTYVKNSRRHLMAGIRERIANERIGRKFLMLWSFLLDAGELA